MSLFFFFGILFDPKIVVGFMFLNIFLSAADTCSVSFGRMMKDLSAPCALFLTPHPPITMQHQGRVCDSCFV